MEVFIQKLDRLGRYKVFNNSQQSIEQIPYTLHFCVRYIFTNVKNNTLISDRTCDKYILRLPKIETVSNLTSHISKLQINALRFCHEKQNPVKLIKNISQVESVNKNILNTSFDSITNDENRKLNKKFNKGLTIPPVIDIQEKSISTVLGIYIGTNTIAWALLGRKEEVLEWKCLNYGNASHKYKDFQLLSEAFKLNAILPKSDVYVINELICSQRMKASSKLMDLFMLKEKLKSMILALLAIRNSSLKNEFSVPETGLYIMRSNQLAKLYSLLVGQEIISSAKIIDMLLHVEDNTNDKEKYLYAVNIPKTIMDEYKDQVSELREQMNWSLLISATFLQFKILEKHYYRLHNDCKSG